MNSVKSSIALSAFSILVACSGDMPPTDSPPVGPPSPDGVLASLANCESLELLALYPYLERLTAEPDAELFHGHPVLGRAAVADAADRDAILSLIERGLEDSKGDMARCFEPRHGLAVRANGRSIDFVICYECLQLYVYEDGVPGEAQPTTADFESVVSDWFTRHGLTIHEK